MIHGTLNREHIHDYTLDTLKDTLRNIYNRLDGIENQLDNMNYRLAVLEGETDENEIDTTVATG